ncbi:hypothetical protein PHMEG_00041790, partial [Phytophthora megakarya]
MLRSPNNTNKKKLRALQILESRSSTVVAVAGAVGVDRSTLYRWKKDASRIAASRPNRCFVGPSTRAHVYVQKPGLEQKYELLTTFDILSFSDRCFCKLLGWIIPLRIYQLSTANALNVFSSTLCFAFTGTQSLTRRFLKRNRLTFANYLTTPVRLQDVANVFSHSILRTVEEDGILSYLDGPAKYASVYNMDQTA